MDIFILHAKMPLSYIFQMTKQTNTENINKRNHIDIHIDDSHTGSGKTQKAIERIVEKPCKVLFVTEKVSSADEVKNRIEENSNSFGTKPIVKVLNNESTGIRKSVVDEISELPRKYECLEHVIVLITHAAMMRCKFDDFHDWVIVIDEVPQFIKTSLVRTHLDYDFFSQNYTICPSDENYAQVKLTPKGRKLEIATLMADDSHAHLKEFHQQLLDGGSDNSDKKVFCNLKNLKEMKNKKVQWCWISAYPLHNLSHFRRIEMLGNKLRSNVHICLSENFYSTSVNWLPMAGGVSENNFLCRDVHIYYFSCQRISSKTFFQSDVGSNIIREIGKIIAKDIGGKKFIWSMNDIIYNGKNLKNAVGLPIDRYLTPRQAGSNLYKDCHYAAMLYSAKASNNLVSMLENFGIHSSEWIKSVEYEAILQFMARTSIRDRTSDDPLHFYVFDKSQADYLAEYFRNLKYAAVYVEQHPSSPVIEAGSARGRKRIIRTPEEQNCHEEMQRKKDAERKRKKKGKI